MLILGLTKTTLLDYPGEVAATIFTGGCNFLCPFCHNGQLVTKVNECNSISTGEILAFLNRRKGVLGGVCISGGEPTIHADLPEFIRDIRKMQLKIKLDTNGSNPLMLEELISDGLLDYVAMDIKNVRDKYALTAGCTEREIENVEESIEILKKQKVAFEFRTTVVKNYHELNDLARIAESIDGICDWYIQGYKESSNVISKSCEAYSDKELKDMVNIINRPFVKLRGID